MLGCYIKYPYGNVYILVNKIKKVLTSVPNCYIQIPLKISIFILFKAFFFKSRFETLKKLISVTETTIAFSHFNFEFCVILPLGEVVNCVIIFQEKKGKSFMFTPE